MVFVSETLVWETESIVGKPETIFRMTGEMVSMINKTVFFAKTIVSVIGTMVCVNIAMVPTSETTVVSAKKTVSVAPTMVCKVLSVVFLMVDQIFANPKLQPARIMNINPLSVTSLHFAKKFCFMKRRNQAHARSFCPEADC
jgi:hypothetical protein